MFYGNISIMDPLFLSFTRMHTASFFHSIITFGLEQLIFSSKHEATLRTSLHYSTIPFSINPIQLFNDWSFSRARALLWSMLFKFILSFSLLFSAILLFPILCALFTVQTGGLHGDNRDFRSANRGIHRGNPDFDFRKWNQLLRIRSFSLERKEP